MPNWVLRITLVCCLGWFWDLTSTQAQTEVIVNGPAGNYTCTVTLPAYGPITLSSPFTGPAGSYTIVSPDPVVIERTDGSVTIRWKPSPTPPPNPPGPPPNPPNPPNPPSPPNPPVPPIPVAGLHVLIVYESDDLSKYPQSQVNILYDPTLRQYLDSVTPVGTDGATHEYRIWDKDVNAIGDSKYWADALARKRGAVPWIIVSNGTTGIEAPLPNTVSDTIAIIRPFELKSNSYSSSAR